MLGIVDSNPAGGMPAPQARVQLTLALSIPSAVASIPVGPPARPPIVPVSRHLDQIAARMADWSEPNLPMSPAKPQQTPTGILVAPQPAKVPIAADPLA